MGQAEMSDGRFAVDDPDILLAPYVWKCSGTGFSARAEATMPGAYLRANFQRSASLSLAIDGTANQGCPAASMPVVEVSIDDGPYRTVPLTRTGELYNLSLGDKLDREAIHRLEFYFRAADLAQHRWTSPTAHLRIAALQLEPGGRLLPCPRRPKRAIIFGDSITEGVGVDGLFTSWQSLGVNNARCSWCPFVATALDCEYGQLGSGGQGMVATKLELPPLPITWDHYDAQTSRLSNGRLVPEPDCVFCAMGTNDYRPEDLAKFQEAYVRWLAAVRQSCPTAQIFSIIPPLGTHRQEIAGAVVTRYRQGDTRVHWIDTAALKSGFVANRPTRLAYDGVHPSLYGNALLSGLILAEVQKVLDGKGH